MLFFAANTGVHTALPNEREPVIVRQMPRDCAHRTSVFPRERVQTKFSKVPFGRILNVARLQAVDSRFSRAQSSRACIRSASKCTLQTDGARFRPPS